MREIVWVGPIGEYLIWGGRSSFSFSTRPGSSSPPEKCCTSVTFTPKSSERMPRIHTGAVIWYSGAATRLPFRSSGLRMPLLAEKKMQEWRNEREGNTGMAMNGGLSELSVFTYEESDISEASNSWKRAWRQNVS